MKDVKNKDIQTKKDSENGQEEIPQFVKIISDKYFKFGFVIFFYLIPSWRVRKHKAPVTSKGCRDFVYVVKIGRK